MSKAPSAAPASPASQASPAGPEDWLGYGLYADSLWARVRLSLNTAKLQSPHALPTADPLVVGVYGEWGAGKSRLLVLVYDRARRQNGQDVALRIQDPDAFQASPLLSVTVPVWFHPWRYEHEPHLAVPLLMHISEALQSTLKDMSTWRESADQALVALGQPAAELMEQAQEKWSLVEATAKAVSKVAGHGVAQAVVGVAAGLVGAGELAKDGLDMLKDTANRIAGDDEKGEEKGRDKGKEKEKPDSKAKPSPPTYTADGRHYYQVQKFLRDLSRITPEEAKAQGVELTHAVELRFVVFIDDLDRCLPEKAVAMLEVIKTVFNVESFAFVVALDDEVIERGISHRYRDYRFKGAKPEMPITGFEYLEKIVHLPFRLPPLTRLQALELLAKNEERLLRSGNEQPNLPPIWTERFNSKVEGAGAVEWPSVGPSAVCNLLLDSFEAYVPRKLLRTQELMHQWQCVLAARGSAMRGEQDKAMFLALALLQLFAPELYRLVRRRPGLWREWMNAYLRLQEGFDPVFLPQRRERPPHFELNASDARLYRWAAMGPYAGLQVNTSAVGAGFTLNGGAVAGDLAAWRAVVAENWSNESATLHSAEQVRLPLVLALCEYRNAHRHAFNPLLMAAALVHTLRWESANQVGDLVRYWSLLPEEGLQQKPSAGQVDHSVRSSRRPRNDLHLNTLREVLTSSDASTRSTLVERLGLLSGDVLPNAVVLEVARAVVKLSVTQQLAVWAQLAPYLDAAQVPASLQEIYRGFSLADVELPLLAPSLKVLGQHGLLDAFGLARQVAAVRQELGQRRDDINLVVQEREQAANTVAALGDERFEFDPRRWQLPSRRARVFSGQTWRDATPHEEPIPGFVRVEGGNFVRGAEGESDNSPSPIDLPAFYMARTLVTVAQWQCFVDAGGYENPEWWDAPQGWAWRQGELVSDVEDVIYRDWLAKRPAVQRAQPWRWTEQVGLPQRPVCGVTWFEARAYARWLTAKLQADLMQIGLAGWQVHLPTEDQTERAMRAADMIQAGQRRFPWGEDESRAPLHANCSESGVGHASLVGMFGPNPLGLYDIAGNLWAWQDNIHEFTASNSVRLRIPGDTTLKSSKDIQGSDRPALRGGSWIDPASCTECAHRERYIPDDYGSNIGARFVLTETPTVL